MAGSLSASMTDQEQAPYGLFTLAGSGPRLDKDPGGYYVSWTKANWPMVLLVLTVLYFLWHYLMK